MIKIDLDPSTSRITQGDIISNVEFIEYAEEKEGQFEISKLIFPLVFVLSQDCDLEQDYNNRHDSSKTNQDKHLISVIVAPLYNFEHLKNGEHLIDLGLSMAPFSPNPSKTDNRFLKNNQNPRYHYLAFEPSLPIVDSVIDFKHYFTVNINYITILKRTNFVGAVKELYREDISQRFASFLSRIGLP
jgi:hypothetical protein